MFDFSKDENIQKYLSSAEKGNAEVQYFLGTCFEDGEIVEQDYRKALYWYEKAAEQGLRDAEYSTGRMYFGNASIDADYEKAIYWMIRAADQGHSEAKKYLKKLNK